MHNVLENALFSIAHDAAQKLVFMRRKNVKISTVDWDALMDEVIRVIQPLRGQRLFLDVRMAPGDNAPGIEHKVNQFRRQLSGLFPVCATLVATAVGRLQVQRMSRERGDSDSHVFLDESEALAYLRTQSVATPSR